MKFCPLCKNRYDEEILRFCTKDGTPLIEEEQPNFTALPSDNDLGEETVIRRKTPPPIPPTVEPVPDFEPEHISSPRIVIPTTEEAGAAAPQRETVRAKTTTSIRRQPPPQKSNTGLVVLATVLGTVVLLGAAGVIFYALSGRRDNANHNQNINVNLNPLDTNLNTNLNINNSPVNFNYSVNSNSNFNFNSNINANLKTPTPTKTPTATPTPGANSNFNINAALNTNTMSTPPANTRPSPRPSPSATPKPSQTPDPGNRPVNAGILNGRAVSLPKPAYPPTAKFMRASGQVAVQVMVDEAGNVLSAKATSGNPLLRAPAEAAARQSRFNPVKVDNQAVKATGVVLYNFVNQ